MTLLLDTQVLLWWAAEDDRLGPRARAVVTEAEVVSVSAVTGWEIEVKRALGRLDAPEDLPGLMVDQAFTELPLTLAHAIAAGRLPRHHDDPFDRALVAQARLEGLRLVTADSALGAYDVRLVNAGH